MLKAIVFDFDGVLVDSEPLHYRAFADIGRELGFELDYPQYLDELIGYDDRDVFRLMLTGKPEPGDEPTEQRVVELMEAKRTAFGKLFEQGAAMIAGTWALVDELVGQMPLAIASGATRSDIELMLTTVDRGEIFDAIVSADDVRQSKPHPQTYALAVEQLAARHGQLALEPGHCLAIEDTAAGVASARGAGLMTLGLATTGPAERLSGADRVVERPGDLSAAALREWFG